jgi:crotonobetainyl-CoA:carnitine CoA-transferase CaiB-like acyl-CoA transferase
MGPEGRSEATGGSTPEGRSEATGGSTAAPLAGITVVAMEQAVAAPMCTRVLADFGARVIKVENPNGGDFARDYDDVVNGPGGLAAHFVCCNRGKESVTLNLKSPAGMDVLHRLLDRADAFVSNLAPGSTARLGLAPADLAVRHPDVIPVEIDGYGPGGPISHKRAYDLLIQAEAGSCAVTGYPDMPAKPGPAVADVSTGLYAALSILALLVSRDRRSGPAPAVELSLFDTMADIMGYQLTYTQHSGIDQQPLGVSSPAVAPYGAFPTRDGQTVVLGTTNDREWQRLAREIIDRPDLADDLRFSTNADRCAHRDEVNAAIETWCAQHDLAEIQKIADDAGIGNSRYNLPSEVVVHPQLTARDRWRTVETPKGDVPALLPPPVISGYEAPMAPVPGLGEHTDAVLGELGLTSDEIARLRDEGAIGPAYA